MELSDKLRTDFIDMTKLDGSKNWDEYWKASQHNSTIKKINKGIYLRSFGTFLLDRGFTHLLVSYEGSGDCGDAYLTEGFKDNEFKHCIKCSQVYRKASFDDSEYRNCKEERYSTDVMPSYGLIKVDCSKCK